MQVRFLVRIDWKISKIINCLIVHSLLTSSEVTLSKYNIGLLTQLEKNLKQQKIELSEAIINLKKKLVMLWDCLDVDKNVRKKFNAYNGCSQVND